MDGFQLHSSLLDYDPEEEERQRTAAFAALAAQRTPDDSAMSPGQLELQPEFQPEPSADAISALAMAGGAPTRVDDPVRLVPEAPARIEAEVPTVPGDAEAFQADEAAAQVAEPTKGLDSPARSPEMKEAAPAASPVTPTATSPVGEMKTADPPPQQDPFEALMLRGEEQRRKQLEAYDKEGPPGINGWALLADVAFNKGKSIPNMLAQVDADKRSYREGRQRLLTSGHADPVNQMLAMERIRTGQGNLAARTHGQESREEALRKETEADALAGDRFRQYAQEKGFYDPSMEGLGGKALAKQFPMRREDKTLALAPELNQAAGEKAEEQAKGRVRGEHELRGEKAETAGAVRGAQVDEEARLLPDKPLTPQQKAQEARADRSLQLQEEGATAARAERERVAGRQAETDKANWLDNFGKRTEKVRPMALPLSELLQARDEARLNKKPMDGLGVETGASLHGGFTRGLENAFSNDPAVNEANARAVRNQENLRFVADYVLRKETGAAANLTEVQKNKIKTASGPGATQLQIDTALDILENLVRSEYQTAGSSRPEWARESMERAGLGPDRWGFRAAQQSATASTPGLPPPPAAGDSLPTTDQKPSQVPTVKNYLDLNDEDEDLGVSYGR